MISVAHVITSLDVGGAERALCHLAPELRRRGLRQLVVCLLPPGAMAASLTGAGVAVHALHMRPEAVLRSGAAGATELVRLLRRAGPDVVQTWMYHADLVGGLAARAAGIGDVVWNVRHADLPLEGYGPLTAAVGRASALASRLVPRRIVTNSAVARDAHVARGYPPARMRLVPNGVPEPDPRSPTRAAARRELGLPADALVVGRVGRFHPQKDLPTFLRAARDLHDAHPGTRFALVGQGMDAANAELARWIREQDLGEAVHLHGPRADAARLQVAFDVAVSSSAFGETCPNAVLEAMAAGVPVATTDVGDSARMVGEAGAVVPPRDPGALAAALRRLAGLSPEARDRLGEVARERARTHFSLDAMADGYEAVYRELLGRRDPGPA